MLCGGIPRVPQLSPLLVRLGCGRMGWEMSGEYDGRVLNKCRGQRDRGLDDIQKKTDGHWGVWKNGMSLLLMSIVTVASNLTFSPPNIGFFFFLSLFGFSLTSLKEQAMFPRAQLFEAHTFGHPTFSVPTQAVQTLSPLTFPQWQGPGGQTIATLHSAHSWVASGRTNACFVCWFWPTFRETPQSLHGECRTPCQDHYASLQWLWIAAHYSTADLGDVQFTQGHNARPWHRYQNW